MEITKEQLTRVESYLNLKNITHLDLRMEVLDHIVSDIESKMEIENLDFETVFKNVIQKWKPQFNNTSSFYFGVGYSAPKIVIEKAKKQFKKWSVFSFFFFFFSFILIDKLSFSMSDSLKNIINLSFKIITLICFICHVFLMIVKSKDKVKTTFSFILRTQNLNILFGIILFFDFNILNKEGNFDTFLVTILFAFVLSNFSYFHFYSKHKKVIKKYKS